MSKDDTTDAPPRHNRRATDDLTREFDTLHEMTARLIEEVRTLDCADMSPVLRVILDIQKIQHGSIVNDEKLAARNGTLDDDRIKRHAELRAEIGRALDRIRETKAAAIVLEFSRP